MLGDERLLNFKKQIALASNPSDPLYSRSNDDIKAFLAYRLLADDGGTDTQRKAQIVMQYPWIPQVQYNNSMQMYNSQQGKINPTEGYNANSISGKLGSLLNPAPPVDNSKFIEKPKQNPKQMLAEDQVRIASAYTAAPKGSPIKKQLLAQNPWLRTYWDASSKYYEENPITAKGPLADYLTSIGINPNTETQNSGFGTKKRKVTASKAKFQ